MHAQWTRRGVLRAGGVAAVLGLAGCTTTVGEDGRPVEETLPIESADQYSAPGCSCCHRYAGYLRDRLEGDLSESTPEDVDAVKREHGIPPDYRSCHTVVLEDYVVEGHVPVEAIATLLEERPAIDGIALPGMPPGSPGMPGETDGPLTVYAVGGGRTGEVFAEL